MIVTVVAVPGITTAGLTVDVGCATAITAPTCHTNIAAAIKDSARALLPILWLISVLSPSPFWDAPSPFWGRSKSLLGTRSL